MQLNDWNVSIMNFYKLFIFLFRNINQELAYAFK